MAECIGNGGLPPVDPGDARDGLRVIDAALRSEEQRRTVELE
jgi:predicted dehydrogenase